LAYETIYQIKNLYPGQNFFNIKGVFLNTGTWGEFMSILFILSIGFAYYYSTHRIKSIKITFLSIGLIFSLFLVASNSRAAWMGTILSIAYLLFIIQKQNLVRLNIKYKLTLILSFSILILSILIGLYKYKRASADGRLLIWQVSAQMVKDKPIWGFGIDGFKTNYMNYQADYFFDNTESSFASLAGNNQFVFNEFIKIWIEQGLLGLILFLLIIESSLKTYKI
jgi:O-antigen ligase